MKQQHSGRSHQRRLRFKLTLRNSRVALVSSSDSSIVVVVVSAVVFIYTRSSHKQGDFIALKQSRIQINKVAKLMGNGYLFL
jgi:hypothetical protein